MGRASWLLRDHCRETALRALHRAGGSAAETGGPFDLAPGQVSDDTEMALGLAREVLEMAAHSAPTEFHAQMGWVKLVLQNALHRLLHAPDSEEGLATTVMAGGDTDTNGCIAGALLGAVHGEDGIPGRWTETVLSCQTDRGETYQTGDARSLAANPLEAGA